MVATDSYRLAEAEVMTSRDQVSMLVPVSAMQELMRIINDFEDEVHITHDDQQVLFRAGDIELVARLIEGNYPEYRTLIPKKFDTTALLDRADFLNITKVSSLFARENAGSKTVEVSEKTQQLSIHSVASQLGENNASVNCEVKGSGVITLNSRYLLDALHVMSGDKVSFCFNGKLEASLIKDPSAKEYNHIIMPLKS
jgi:DNA polymerase-3 subunit beta